MFFLSLVEANYDNERGGRERLMDGFYYCLRGPICHMTYYVYCVREPNQQSCLWLLPTGGYYSIVKTYQCMHICAHPSCEHLRIMFTRLHMFIKSSYFSLIAHWAIVVEDTCTCWCGFVKWLICYDITKMWNLRIFQPILCWYSNMCGIKSEQTCRGSTCLLGHMPLYVHEASSLISIHACS